MVCVSRSDLFAWNFVCQRAADGFDDGVGIWARFDYVFGDQHCEVRTSCGGYVEA